MRLPMRRALVLIALAAGTAACVRPPLLVWEGAGPVQGVRSSSAVSADIASVAPGTRRGPWGEAPDETLQVIDSDRAEERHIHARHDLTVVLLRGHGILDVEGRRYTLRAGDVVQIGRGKAHAFTPSGRSTALGIFTPHLDGSDYVPVVAAENAAANAPR